MNFGAGLAFKSRISRCLRSFFTIASRLDSGDIIGQVEPVLVNVIFAKVRVAHHHAVG
jgi:hypothetical protein